MDDQVAAFLRVGDFKVAVGGLQFTGITYLSTALCVEGGAIQDDAEHLSLGVVRDGADQTIVLGFPDDDPFDLGWSLGGGISEKLRLVQSLFECFDRAGFEQFDGSTAADVTVPEHRFAVSIPIEGVSSFGGDLLEEFWWNSVGLVERSGFGAIDHGAPFACHFIEQSVDAFESRPDGSKEVGFLALHDRCDAVGGIGEFWIGTFHHLGDDRDELMEERIPHTELMTVQNSASQESFDDVASFFRSGINVFVDGKATGSDVVGDPTQATAIVAFVSVFHATNFGGSLDDRHEDIDMEVRRYALQDACGPFQSHSCIDVLARQGS